MAFIPPEVEAAEDVAEEEEPLASNPAPSPPLDNLATVLAKLSKDLETLSARVDGALPPPKSAKEAKEKKDPRHAGESKNRAVELLLDSLKLPSPAAPQVSSTTTTPQFFDPTYETGAVPAPVSKRVFDCLPAAYGHSRFHTAERFTAVGGPEAWVRLHPWNVPRNRKEAEVWAFQWDHLPEGVAKEIASRRLLGLIAADRSNEWEAANLLLRAEDEMAAPATLLTMVRNANALKKYKSQRDGPADDRWVPEEDPRDGPADDRWVPEEDPWDSEADP